jgi:hypothetical protein
MSRTRSFIPILAISYFVLFLSCSKESALEVTTNTPDDYYYTREDTIFLKIVHNQYVVEFPNGVNEQQFVYNNLEYKKLKDKYYRIYSNLTKIYNIFGHGIYVSPVYKTLEYGYDRIMFNEVILRFKETTNTIDKNELINRFGLQQVDSTRLYIEYRIINPLAISRAVFKSGFVEYCHPIFLGTPPIPH